MAYYIAEWETTPQNRNISEWDVVVSTGKTPLYPVLKTKNGVSTYWEDYPNFIGGLDKEWKRKEKKIEVLFIDADIKVPELTDADKEQLVWIYGEDYEKSWEIVYSK